MLLNTKRLVLRNFNDSDLETFLAYRNDPEVARYQGWSLPYSREKGKQFILEMRDVHAPKQGQWLQLAVELKEAGNLLGDVAFCIKDDDVRQAVIGFTVASNYWRQGFATEALTALLDYLFMDIDLHRITADCDAENIGSWKTLERLGFRREAHFVESLLIGKEYTSEYYYGLLQREWRARAAFRDC
ncbi:MAG: GNAT family N-acetyltransferase [Anaerolineales bacterium]|nr:GNAT family N-acetyltransferase [Anaerolineales bacterium]